MVYEPRDPPGQSYRTHGHRADVARSGAGSRCSTGVTRDQARGASDRRRAHASGRSCCTSPPGPRSRVQRLKATGDRRSDARAGLAGPVADAASDADWAAGRRASRREPSAARRRRPAARRCGARRARAGPRVPGRASCCDGVVEHGTYHGGQIALLEESMTRAVFQDRGRVPPLARRAPRQASASCWSASTRRRPASAGISYKEAVDEALCFGWIDGIKKRVDEARYTHRFTPRKADSIWSLVNARRVKELIAAKRDGDAGARGVRAARSEEDRRLLVREQTEGARRRRSSGRSRPRKPAWAFFRAQPPGYRRLMTFYRDERQAARDAGAAAGSADQELSGRETRSNE